MPSETIDVRELERLVEAATPGPWSAEIRRDSWSARRLGERFEGLIRVGDRNPGNAFCSVSLGGPGATSAAREDVEANAGLIAYLGTHAKAIVAALAELERVRGELQRLGRDYNEVREAHDDAVGRRGALEAERDTALAEIERLTAALAAAERQYARDVERKVELERELERMRGAVRVLEGWGRLAEGEFETILAEEPAAEENA